MSTTSNEVVVLTDEVAASAGNVMDVAGVIAGLSSGTNQMYSSVKGGDKVAKLKVLAAVTDSESLSDHLREKFAIQDVVIQVIEMPNEKTGEMQKVPRIILITDKGKAFHAVSNGILMSIQNFIGVLGEPGADEGNWPVTVVCDEVKTRNGYKAMTLKLA